MCFKYIGSIGAQFYSGPLPGQQAEGSLALFLGLLGALALAWTGGMLLWQKRASLGVLLPYFAMTAYSVGTAMITGVGRVGFGSDEALESRYCTMVVPFWVSLVVFLLLLAQRSNRPAEAVSSPQRRSEGTEYYQKVAAGSLLAGTILLLGLSSLSATEGAANMSGVQAHCRTVLLDIAAHPGAEIDYNNLVSQGAYAKGLVDGYPVPGYGTGCRCSGRQPRIKPPPLCFGPLSG